MLLNRYRRKTTIWIRELLFILGQCHVNSSNIHPNRHTTCDINIIIIMTAKNWLPCWQLQVKTDSAIIYKKMLDKQISVTNN